MSGEVLAYITGTVTSAVRGGIVNGEYIAMFELQPEGTPERQRRWIRIRSELAAWAGSTDELAPGTVVIAVGNPYRAQGAVSRSTTNPDFVWMLDASRIAIDRSQQMS